MQDIFDYLEPINKDEINEDEGFNERQMGMNIAQTNDDGFDLTLADIVLVGIPEIRGTGNLNYYHAPNAIRKQFYRLHYWHKDTTLADVGNVKVGASLQDTYSAAQLVVAEILRLGKKVVILGGSHDITLVQYYAYKQLGKPIVATCVDALIDLIDTTPIRSENFLMEMLTEDPMAVKQYNHIGFQSYFVHPGLLQTMDNIRFDCFRLGTVKENIEEMEPVMRSSHMLSFDINAIKYSDAPSTHQSPNGFTGEESCMLTRHAGMSDKLNSFGVYGYNPMADVNELTAKQIAQMIWYYIDGVSKAKQEANIEDRFAFTEFNCSLTETQSVFLQSKRTGRWWMQLPNEQFIPCSYKDYLTASNNDYPERWLRAQERE